MWCIILLVIVLFCFMRLNFWLCKTKDKKLSTKADDVTLVEVIGKPPQAPSLSDAALLLRLPPVTRTRAPAARIALDDVAQFRSQVPVLYDEAVSRGRENEVAWMRECGLLRAGRRSQPEALPQTDSGPDV